MKKERFQWVLESLKTDLGWIALFQPRLLVFGGKSLVEQMHFLKSCRVLKVLNTVCSTLEVRVLLSSGAQVAVWSLRRWRDLAHLSSSHLASYNKLPPDQDLLTCLMEGLRTSHHLSVSSVEHQKALNRGFCLWPLFVASICLCVLEMSKWHTWVQRTIHFYTSIPCSSLTWTFQTKLLFSCMWYK